MALVESWGHASAGDTQIWVAGLVSSDLGLLLRAMFGSVALEQPGSGLTYVTPVTTEF